MFDSANLIEYTSTTVPVSSAQVELNTGTIKTVKALRMVSGPSDLYVRFGSATATPVPVTTSDPARSDLHVPGLWCYSATGGTAVFEVHGS